MSGLHSVADDGRVFRATEDRAVVEGCYAAQLGVRADQDVRDRAAVQEARLRLHPSAIMARGSDGDVNKTGDGLPQ